MPQGRPFSSSLASENGGHFLSVIVAQGKQQASDSVNGNTEASAFPAENKNSKLGHAGWPAHTQLDQIYDQLGHASWSAHTQLDQLHDQLDHAGWSAHTQSESFIASLTMLVN